jgi:predicted phosphodiesterase
MKIALISDIHGNMTALNAVLQDIRQQKVDEIICLGDVATIGPQPKEVLARLRQLNFTCILGNHEEAMLDPDSALDYQIAPPLIPALHWCLEELQDEDLRYLSTFKNSYECKLDREFTLLCYHGSPRSTTDVILSTTPAAECSRMLGDSNSALLAGGHTHIQMMRRHESSVLVNPGSVGGAFPRVFAKGETPFLQPWAEYAIVNYGNKNLDIYMRQIPFDTSKLREIVVKSNIPIKDWWLQQYV